MPKDAKKLWTPCPACKLVHEKDWAFLFGFCIAISGQIKSSFRVMADDKEAFDAGYLSGIEERCEMWKETKVA